MNNGKRMEQQWRKGCKNVGGLLYYRFRDSPSAFNGQEGLRFTPSNICDCMMFKSPYLYFIELKSHKGKSIPFSALREVQIDGLCKMSKYQNVIAGFVVDFADCGECYFLAAIKIKHFMETSDRKSIPLGWCICNGIKIETKQLKVNKDYNITKFMEDLYVEQGI